MVKLDNKSKTQLLKQINDVKVRHDTLKQEIVKYTYDIETIEKTINEKIMELDNLEKNYVELIEKLYE